MPGPALAIAAVIGLVALARRKSGSTVDAFDEDLIEWEDGRPRPEVGSTRETTGEGGSIFNTTNAGAEGVTATPSNGAPPPSAPPSQTQGSSPNAPIGTDLAPTGSGDTGGGCVPNAGGGLDCGSTLGGVATAPPKTTMQQSKAMYYPTSGLSPTSADRLLSSEGSKVGAIW